MTRLLLIILNPQHVMMSHPPFQIIVVDINVENPFLITRLSPGRTPMMAKTGGGMPDVCDECDYFLTKVNQLVLRRTALHS